MNYDEDFGTFDDWFPTEFKNQSTSIDPPALCVTPGAETKAGLQRSAPLSMMVLLRARQPLAQADSFIRPTEAVRKGAVHTAACLPSYFLTHWRARPLAESWGLFKPRWVNGRWTGGARPPRATAPVLGAFFGLHFVTPSKGWKHNWIRPHFLLDTDHTNSKNIWGIQMFIRCF